MLAIDLEVYGRAAGWERVPASVLSADVQASSSQRNFPGAILPVIGADGQTNWLALASSWAEWRELQPILSAHAGPTLTDFYGVGRRLSGESPAEAEAIRAGAIIGALLRPGPDCEPIAVKALARLVRALRERPSVNVPGREPTNKLLGRLDLCLAVGDRNGAEAILAYLRDEFRVDTLNQHFLEVRILAQFRDWVDLVSRPWFEMLCFTRKPALIAQDMLRGLWHAHLESRDGDREQLLQAYVRLVRPLALPLFPQVERKEGEALARICELEGIEKPATIGYPFPGLPHEESVSAGAELAGLQSPPHAEPITTSYPRPQDWLKWLEAIHDPEFRVFSIVAADGATEWGIPEQETGAWADALADAMFEAALSGGVARDRLSECLPQLVRTLRSDEGYPRVACAVAYSALLQILSLSEYKTSSERNVAFDLFDGLLSLGPGREAYGRILRDFEGFIDIAAGTATAYWLIDVAATLVAASAPDEDARLRLLNRVLSSLQSVRVALRPAQRAAYNVVAAVAGWEALPLEDAAVLGAPTIPARTSIAIYTLTESAARQAQKALLDVESSLIISLAHDKVASPRLSRLARDSDLFVFASGSATHAASDCIMANRGRLPLAYAVGRGFSSVIRAVEDYFGRPGD